MVLQLTADGRNTTRVVLRSTLHSKALVNLPNMLGPNELMNLIKAQSFPQPTIRTMNTLPSVVTPLSSPRLTFPSSPLTNVSDPLTNLLVAEAKLKMLSRQISASRRGATPSLSFFGAVQSPSRFALPAIATIAPRPSAPPQEILEAMGNELRKAHTPYIDVASIVILKEYQGENPNAFSFPMTLHRMLSDKHESIAWCAHGRAFFVHDEHDFVDNVLPKYCKQTKWASFRRQLSLYGFACVSKGSYAGAFYHELFLRKHEKLAEFMRRVGVHAMKKGPRTCASHMVDPNFEMLVKI